MQPTLTFSFPFSISAHDAITTVAAHFGASVSINGAAPEVPAHIKQAVENTASALYDPSTGVETNPAIAFGALLNGAAGNVPATSAHAAPSADVATSTIAPVVPTDISATLPPATSAPVAPDHGAAAHTANVPATSPAVAEFDSTGLPWDERIHSGNKTKSPSGEWRTKKGADKNMVKAIELELRAKYPENVGATVVAYAVNPAAIASNTSVAVSADPIAKKAAALAYAHTEALRVAGPQQIDDNTLAGLLNNKPATLSHTQAEWFRIYVAKRSAAYMEFMSRPEVPAGNGTEQPAAPVTAAATQPSVVVADLDATGLPWDVRIHVPAKLKDNAGVWLQRFDVSGETKLAVMAELRAALAGNAAAAPSGSPAGAVGGAPVAPTPPAAPVLVTIDEAKADFTKLMQWIVANQQAGRITPQAGPDAAKMIGFADASGNGQLVLMREHTAAFPYVVDMLVAQGAM